MSRIRAALGILAAVTVLEVPAAHADSLPFRDPHATGLLAFCDEAGRPVTHGLLSTRPFVWRAVASTPAPAGDAHSKATLFAYQPRKGSDPGDWSGMALTGSATFTNPLHPMAAATYGDLPLESFVQSYPPGWEGLVQLRMRFTNPDAADAPGYPAAVIRVDGNEWALVSGGGASCSAGRAASTELARLPAQHLDRPQTPVQRAARAAAFAAARSAGAAPGPRDPQRGPSATTPQRTVSARGTGSATDLGVVVAILVVGATVLGAGVLWMLGRRRMNRG